MKAVVLEEPLKFVVADICEPDGPGPGEALVRVHRVGICGSDVAGYLGKMPFYGYPRIPGHELGVEVLEIGNGVDHIAVGDRCAVEPYINNPASFASQRGHDNCCNDLQVLGIHTDGGLRSRFVVPARKLHASTKLEMEQLALVETLGIGCHAIDRCQPPANEHLLVIGAGPIGLSVIEFARQARAKITVMDMNRSRLEFCRDNMGVDHIVQFAGDGSELNELQRITGGEFYLTVLDATGSVASMSGALNYVAWGGTLVFVGLSSTEISFPQPLMHAREMTFLASRNSLPRDFHRVIGLIEDESIDTRPWITHRIGMQELVADFEQFTRPESGVIKAIVQVD
jgi:2-desacetyl-2-hydroxyethyl bacteriochlorophyllide A dehydrogenase